MTQAPATPELVERLKNLATGFGVAPVYQQAAAALEAQQARIAELEAELADVAIPSPYCEICGSCGSEGCGCEHKCKYAHSHPDVVRDMDALQALADRYEKALREAERSPARSPGHNARLTLEAALSSQGRREEVTSGSVPELPGVNTVPLPASPDGLLSDPRFAHLNMLRGGIAKLTPAQIGHLYRGSEAAEVIAEVMRQNPAVQPTDALYGLVNAARRHMATHPVFRTRKIGGEGSRARLEQEDQIASEDALHAAIQAALSPSPDNTNHEPEHG